MSIPELISKGSGRRVRLIGRCFATHEVQELKRCEFVVLLKVALAVVVDASHLTVRGRFG